MRTLALSILLSLAVRKALPAEPIQVKLTANAISPQPVGSLVDVSAVVTNPVRATYVFRWSESFSHGPFHVVRDFSQANDFVWVPSLREGSARIRVTVRNNSSKDTAEAEIPFEIVSRVKGSEPVVTATAHPLVALFSAPSCGDGNQFRVAFQRVGDELISHTNWQACESARSSNAYVAGMRADSDYRMRAETQTNGATQTGGWISHHTGILDGNFPPVSVPIPRRAGGTVSEPLTIFGFTEPWRPIATDAEGHVVWYLPHLVMFSRVLEGGRFLGLASGTNSDNDMNRLQVFQEYDLAGNVVRETNVSRVAEQLASAGIHSSCKEGGKECVPGFHHDALRLPNGHTLVIAGLERMFPAGTQGSKEPVDVLGDLIVDLDEDLQVAWVWNAFDHMDIKRASLEDSKCQQGAGNDGCTPVFLAKTANGWLHSNSLNYEASTGSLLVSIPDQDWVIKIDYGNGKGSGNVLWRLGEGGDFTAQSSDPHPWFSYQHDPGYEAGGSNRILLLDDGHSRKHKDPKANNRGQVWVLDEKAKTASLVYNSDLGVYSFAVGSAQGLSNGGFSFDAGLVSPPFLYSRVVETAADGTVTFAQQAEGALTYRSFRVADMYSKPSK